MGPGRRSRRKGRGCRGGSGLGLWWQCMLLGSEWGLCMLCMRSSGRIVPSGRKLPTPQPYEVEERGVCALCSVWGGVGVWGCEWL